MEKREKLCMALLVVAIFLLLYILVFPFSEGIDESKMWMNLLTCVCIIFMTTLGVACFHKDVTTLKLVEADLQDKIAQLMQIGEKDFQKVHSIVKDSGVGEAWNGLVDSGLYTLTKHDYGVSTVYFTRDIRQLLDSHLLMENLEGYNRRSHMTGLGILGTFLGLTIGLYSLNINVSGSELTKGISTLIGSSGTAFFTSLIGIFFSLIYTFRFNVLNKDVLHAYDTLIGYMHRHMQYRTMDEEIIRAVQKTNEHMEGLHTKVDGIALQLEGAHKESTKVVETGLERIYQFFHDAEENVAHAVGRSIVKGVNKLLKEELTEFINGIHRLEGYLEQSYQSSMSYQLGMNESFQQMLKELIESVHQMKESVIFVEERAQIERKSVQNFYEYLQKSLKVVLLDYLRAEKEVNDRIAEALQGSLKGAFTELTIAMDETKGIVSAAHNILKDERMANETLKRETIESLHVAKDGFIVALADLQRLFAREQQVSSQFKRDICDGIQESLTTVKDFVGQSQVDMREDHEASKAHMDRLKSDTLQIIQELHHTLGETKSFVEDQSALVQKTVVLMDEVRNIGAMFERQEADRTRLLVDSFHDQSRMQTTLDDTLKDLGHALRELEQSMAQCYEGQKLAIHKVTESIESHGSIQMGMANQVAQLSDSVVDLSNHLKEQPLHLVEVAIDSEEATV